MLVLDAVVVVVDEALEPLPLPFCLALVVWISVGTLSLEGTLGFDPEEDEEDDEDEEELVDDPDEEDEDELDSAIVEVRVLIN